MQLPTVPITFWLAFSSSSFQANQTVDRERLASLSSSIPCHTVYLLFVLIWSVWQEIVIIIPFPILSYHLLFSSGCISRILLSLLHQPLGQEGDGWMAWTVTNLGHRSQWIRRKEK